MPIGHQVVRDAVQPGGKGQSAILVTVQVAECPVKGPRRQVFGIVMVSRTIVNIAIDFLDVLFVQLAKRFWIAFGTGNQL